MRARALTFAATCTESVGVTMEWPPLPVATLTPIVMVASPTTSVTSSPDTAPFSMPARWLSHSDRAAGSESTDSNQVASAGTPTVGRSASGSGGMLPVPDMPTRPTSDCSGPTPMASACTRSRPRTSSRTVSSSSSRLSSVRARSRGAAAPGSSSPRKVNPNVGAALLPVGRCSERANPPSGGNVPSVMSVVIRITPSTVPMRKGESTPPSPFAARNTGTWSDVKESGPAVVSLAPTPIPTYSLGVGSSTRYSETCGAV